MPYVVGSGSAQHQFRGRAHGPCIAVRDQQAGDRGFPPGLQTLADAFHRTHQGDLVRELVGGRFRERILARNGVFVLRPDSGDPVTVSGRLLDILEERMGCTVNAKGFKVPPPQVRMLWGDGRELETIRHFLEAAKAKGWSAENFVFGMGGGLLQKINRDTQCFAMKSSAQCRNGVWHDIRKTPKGGQDKISKAGKLGLERGPDGTWTTFRLEENEHTDLLETVFEDGGLVRDQTFEQIREWAARYV